MDYPTPARATPAPPKLIRLPLQTLESESESESDESDCVIIEEPPEKVCSNLFIRLQSLEAEALSIAQKIRRSLSSGPSTAPFRSPSRAAPPSLTPAPPQHQTPTHPQPSDAAIQMQQEIIKEHERLLAAKQKLFQMMAGARSG